ncbi:hypothetical protein [Kordiimonas sp. SCSIO 12610]|uniref:hypothetical protein n=1 Tax=Kordiimonas sp. SCSIO 12610 TaxID=2829597 RepID=UPI00210A8CFE|nr:hypothetical protein [Kordiimonas sp. SCSIO 12610]UTW55716.1 hypothetical protein KFF44_02155 [Kordiimonas sp. SCSIO 12610]
MQKINRYSKVMSLAAILGITLTSVAQDQQDDDQAPSDGAPVQIVKPSQGQKRFFLQTKQKNTRQTGPKLAAPRSIIPEPFVPAGSIKIPAPTSTAIEEKAVDGLPNENGQLSIADTESQTDEQTVEGSEDLNSPQSLSDVQEAQAPTDFYEEGDLSAFDPSKAGVLDNQAEFNAAFWQGYDRKQYLDRLNRFKENAASPVMNEITRKVVLSPTDIPETQDAGEIDLTIKTRLSLLASKGYARDYRALIDNLPKDRDWSSLSREFAQSHLIASKLADACEIAEAQRKSDNSEYWLRLSAFCEAAEGNRGAVDFQLGILEEIAEIEPTFYRLIDHILIEAEENSSGTLRDNSQIEALEGALEINVLEAAMARLARIQINEFKLENVNPMAVSMMLAVPSVSTEAKAKLIQMSLRQGWLTASDYQSFYRALEPDEAEKSAAISFATAGENSDNVDATLANLIAQEKDETIRMNALENAWFRALQSQTTSTTGPVFAMLTKNVEINAVFGDKASLFARIALLDGDSERALAWLRTLRTRAANNDPSADIALKNMWPMMVTGLNIKPTTEQFNIWWAAQSETSDRFERANLLLSTFDALGIAAPEGAWETLEKGPAALSGEVPSPALWRSFLIAVNNQDRPLALSLGFRLLSPTQGGQLSASLVGSVLGNLKGLGFNEETQKLATEILIAQGL